MPTHLAFDICCFSELEVVVKCVAGVIPSHCPLSDRSQIRGPADDEAGSDAPWSGPSPLIVRTRKHELIRTFYEGERTPVHCISKQTPQECCSSYSTVKCPT